MGSSDKPTPISDGEIKRILGQFSESAVNQKIGITFEWQNKNNWRTQADFYGIKAKR